MVELGVVLLERHHVIGALFSNFAGDVFLRIERIYRHDAAFDIESLE